MDADVVRSDSSFEDLPRVVYFRKRRDLCAVRFRAHQHPCDSGQLVGVIGQLRIGGEECFHRVFLAMEDGEAVDVGDAGAGQVEGGDAAACGQTRVGLVNEQDLHDVGVAV